MCGAVVLLVLAAGCSQQPTPPPTRTDVVEFAASGTSGGDAFGRYVMIGDLSSTSLRTFRDLPFSARLFSTPGSTPKMSVSLVDVRPGSEVSCRISVDGRVVAAQTVRAPGQDVLCQAPAGSTG